MNIGQKPAPPPTWDDGEGTKEVKSQILTLAPGSTRKDMVIDVCIVLIKCDWSVARNDVHTYVERRWP